MDGWMVSHAVNERDRWLHSKIDHQQGAKCLAQCRVIIRPPMLWHGQHGRPIPIALSVCRLSAALCFEA